MSVAECMKLFSASPDFQRLKAKDIPKTLPSPSAAKALKLLGIAFDTARNALMEMQKTGRTDDIAAAQQKLSEISAAYRQAMMMQRAARHTSR